MGNNNSLFITINGSAKDFIDELDKVKKETRSLEKVLGGVAKSSALLFAGFAAALAVVTKAFATYETALVGVGKTTNIEGKKLDAFGKKFQKLSSEIPVATNELLGIAQAAGQLGVEGEANLIKFTETIAKLGVATNLTGEQAATSIARILNVTKEGIETIDRFGSVIVALGNNTAATESEIVKMATEVARSSAVFGVTAAQAAALGATLKATGQQAQLGGSVIGKTFLTIQKVIDGGGKQLENFAKITGITGDQLKKTFQDDAAGVLQSFLAGLGELEGGTSAIFAALEGFGLKGEEVNKVLPVLAKNTLLVAKSFNIANKEVENATALDIEAAKAFNTLASEGKKVSNNLANIATNIGEQLAPQLLAMLKSINSVLKSISELDKETLSLIATFLKWGAIITGGIAAAAAYALAAIKISGILAALTGTFGTAALAASGFWVALTGPIGIAILGVVAITAAFFALKDALKEKSQPDTLISITDELKKINKEIDELESKRASLGGADLVGLKNLKEQREELEKLREAKLAASEDFGTGALLKRKVNTEFDPTNPDLGFDEQEIPLKAGVKSDDLDLAKVKANEDKKTSIIDAGTQERIEKAKQENATLKELAAARGEGLLAEDVEFLQRKADIDAEFKEAGKIKNDEERALALENLKLQHEEELLAIEEQNLLLDEQAATRQEEKTALDEELRELSKEQQAQFTAEDKLALQASIDSDAEAEKKASLGKIKRNIEEQNQFKQDEIKFGTQFAQLKQFFNKEEVQGLKSTSAQLVQLTNSKNSTLKGIGKAAARTNAAIATAEGAIKAYSSLAGIPIVGPVLGGIAAAALIAYGVEQQSRISSLATGGFVPPTSGGARDRFPAMLEPNELVVPAAIAPNFIQAAGIPDTQARDTVGDQNGGPAVIEIILEERAGEMISLEQREGQALGTIGSE